MEENEPIEAVKATRLGVMVTVDGEKVVWVTEKGDQYIEEPEQKPLVPLPVTFKQKHHDAIVRLYELIQEVKSKPQRIVPLIQKEVIEGGLTKPVLKDLERTFALVKSQMTTLQDANGKNKGKRKLVFFTPQGNAYVREKVLCKPLPSNPQSHEVTASA